MVGEGTGQDDGVMVEGWRGGGYGRRKTVLR